MKLLARQQPVTNEIPLCRGWITAGHRKRKRERESGAVDLAQLLRRNHFLRYELLTILLVENDLELELHFGFERLVNLGLVLVFGLGSVKKLTGATLLHDLGPAEASELAEAIRAVDDGVDGRNLRVSKDKVAVWKGKGIVTN